ncbi:MAG: ATP-binding cassette domain-containing protein [Burkholderiales bacterium]|jgi:tungstate transport system ATP-binding protein|nr:ATP-binding cassette domain-containing protein [Betaproteobacteria bacterium]
MVETPSSNASLLPVVLQDVSVIANQKPILRDIDLEITRGTRTVILGANGAGKSTLLRVLHGLVKPSSGTALNVTSQPLTDVQLRAHDAMLFQRPVMLRTSAFNNVLYAAQQMSHTKRNGDAREQAVREALRAVGLEGIAERPARVLSGGEQQRIAFARALVRQPEVLYLDEPTASLDPRSARQIEDCIQRAAASGVTIVMTTHNLALAKRIAESIVFLYEGRITETTPASRFFSQPESTEGRDFLEGEAI